MMLKCVIIDDEPLAREVVQEHLKKFDYVSSVREFSNARNALFYLEKHDVDVLFLDIEMPEMTGIEFLKTLSKPPLTIFTTAYRNYAFEGFELGVIDFLLKPISFSRFSQSLDKVRDFLTLKEQNSNIETNDPDQTPESTFVKSGLQRIKLHFEDVTHIQGLKDYAIIFTSTNKIVIKGSIKAMLDIFPKTRFIRVHKSFIVAISKITRIEKNRIVLHDHQIPIGRSYKEEVESMM